MNTKEIMCGCGAVVMAAMTLFAYGEKQPGAKPAKPAGEDRLRIRGLGDDKDNAEVPMPAGLNKPAANRAHAAPEARKTVSSDVISESAKDEAAAGRVKPQNTTTLADKDLGLVIPPSAEVAKTVEDAVRLILGQVGKQVGTVSSNGVEKLVMPYHQLGDGKSYQVEWRKALRHLLTPVGYSFTEDDELVLFGLVEEVDAKHVQLAQDRLTANRTPIMFTTSEEEGGMELGNAINMVAKEANITIVTDYMEPGDLYVAQHRAATKGKLSAEDIGKAKDKSAAQQNTVKRTKFNTNGQQIEWRTVLREILNPHGYGFVEVQGVVRIAKHEKIRKWGDEEVAKRPLTAKVIRLYHADPEAVVERVMKIKGLLHHPNASLQATRKKDDNTGLVKNLNARIQTSSGSQTGQSDTSSQLFDKLVRPRTVPAIIAYDVEENLAAIEEKIRLFDIKEKQILIEAIIFQLDTSNGEGDMDGFKWSGFEKFVPLYGTFGNVANAARTFAGVTGATLSDVTLEDGTTVKRYTGGKDGFKIRRGGQVWMRTDAFDFQTVIQLIRSKSNAKLLSSPMVVVGDHSEAAIQVSDITPIPEVQASSLSGSSDLVGLQESLNIQWNMLRTGILLWVSPEITENGSSVRLTAHPQVVSRGNKIDLSAIDTTGNTFKKYPVYNYELTMHEMDTRATVPTGATLMFGGLIKNREEEVEDKVRWLGDIPVIGWFFRSKTKTVVQENLIIMIRPTILEDEDETGFEKNALKEAKPLMTNSGRDLKKTPLEGPYTYEQTKKNVKNLYEERVVKPFEDGKKDAK